MRINSIEFIIFFLIIFFLYWKVCCKSKNFQNGLLFIASLFFYGCWDWRFLGLLLSTAFSTYFAGVLFSKVKSTNRKRLTFIIVLVLNIGILFYFKYFNFFVQAFVDTFRLFGKELSFSTLRIVLPIGISFYTFSALSYCIDVYRGKIEVTKDLLAFLAYVTFFPAILSGPISRATLQLPQYRIKRIFSYADASSACKLILWGAIVKFCLADRIGIYVDTVFSNIPQNNGTTLLLASLLFSIQIYADFAGYSMLAIGLGKLLGINLQENFARPYFAKTVTEFWRRWHISLTTWFRDYIYFPLGGSRVGMVHWMINVFIVFLISGLWHGADYSFLLWGGLHSFFMIIERLIYGKRIKEIADSPTLGNMFRIVVTFCIVSFCWIFFRATSFSEATTIIVKIFSSVGIPYLDYHTLLYSLIFGVVVFAKDLRDEYHINKFMVLWSRYSWVRIACYYILLLCVLEYSAGGQSFIYFKF